MNLDELTENIIGAAIEVHRELGPGLLESSYEKSLAHELSLRGITGRRQMRLPIVYKELEIDDAYRIDLLVEDQIIVELKTVDRIEDIHKAQLLTYLKMSGKSVGLLINFQSVLLKDGIRRIVNNYKHQAEH